MVRATILYEQVPDEERYAQHLRDYAEKVPCSTFRHGRAFGSPFGDPPFAYQFEFEWDTMDDFKAATRDEAFATSGQDAMAMGIPFTVTFVELS